MAMECLGNKFIDIICHRDKKLKTLLNCTEYKLCFVSPCANVEYLFEDCFTEYYIFEFSHSVCVFVFVLFCFILEST